MCTIKRVLEMLSEGRTLWEISRELDMEYSALTAMLEHMVKMGYLSHGTKKEKDFCRTCPLNSLCAQKNYRIYYITEKGRKLIS
jgi:predicted transcriptional regulator